MSVPQSSLVPKLEEEEEEYHLEQLLVPSSPHSPEMTPERLAAAAAAMPPPTVTVVFPTPPPIKPPSLTVQQLLAQTPQAVLHPSTRSCGWVPNLGSRPAHTSSKRNGEYEPILVESLYPVFPAIVEAFRDRIRRMSESVKITFKDPLVLPWDACSMVSEAMVTTYLDTQVLFAAWQAVLRMVPAVRDYDLEMVKQAPVDHGVPDQMFAMITNEGPKILAIVEFKGPGIVTQMLSVIRDHLAGVRGLLTDDWRAVTRQLRKYAASSGILNLLVMDEHTAIYFRFHKTVVDETEAVSYLVATTTEFPSKSIPGLSIRELVVFVLLRALDEKGVKLRDTQTTEDPHPLPTYRDVLNSDTGPPNDGSGNNNSKRPGSPAGTRLQPKRGKPNGGEKSGTQHGMLDQFDEWVLNSSVQLQFLPDVAPIRVANGDSRNITRSPDSGFHDEAPSPGLRKFHAVPTTVDATGRHTASLVVERVITKNVALLATADRSVRVIGKHFGLHRDAPRWLTKELAAYAACEPLQGIVIPYLHGVCRIVQSSPFANIVILTEFINPGTSISDLVYEAYGIYDTDDDEEVARLARLQETGTKAVQAIHGRNVVHNDLAGRNLVISSDGESDDQRDGERLVVVDFDCAMVMTEEPRRFADRVEGDLTKYAAAFVPKRGPWCR